MVSNMFQKINVFLITIFISSLAFADIPEQPRLTSLLKGDPAPFAGVLLNVPAAAKIFTEKDYSLTECNLRIDAEVNKMKAEKDLMISNLQTNLNGLHQQYDFVISAKDKEIDKLIDSKLQNPNDYTYWWFAGGLVLGIGVTVAVAFSVAEIR